MRISDDDAIVGLSVVRGVDRFGRSTTDPVDLVEGELLLTRSDGTSQMVNVFRHIEWLPAIVSA